MSANLFKRYFWLMDVIYRSNGITREEINRRWAVSELNERKENELPERTFHRYREAIENIFDINIVCDRHGDKRYHIENLDHLDITKKRLLEAFAISNLTEKHLLLDRHISIEEVPSSEKYLMPILNAMENRQLLKISYQNFYAEKATSFPVEPWGLKHFRQRWYMVGYSPDLDEERVYGLDRIQSLETLQKKFEMPDDFSVNEYFNDSFGVYTYSPEFDKAVTIRLRVDPDQIAYLRTVPFHHSQTETTDAHGNPILTLHLIPSYDFIHELLKYGEGIEVMEPLELREKIAEQIKEMYKIYHD